MRRPISNSEPRPWQVGTGLILGIETSCDETAAAVVRRGTTVLSNIVSSQAAMHAAYGGVVPELASREHLRHIVPVVREALAVARVDFADLDAIAVTEGPGLAGALLVGILYAKALAFAIDRPLVAINHLEGHIHAVVMEARRQPDAALHFPVLALVVSGGHTHLYLAQGGIGNDVWTYTNVGRTVDDAAGEAFDKVAKLLGLGYPGGPWIDSLAVHGNSQAVPFHFHAIKAREGADAAIRFDFSFSGIKSAVARYVQAEGMLPEIGARRLAVAEFADARVAEAMTMHREALLLDGKTLDLLASFQAAVVGNLMRQTFAAAEHFGARSLLVCGGVAANRELRSRFVAEAERRGLPISFPSVSLSTDNAAMIAAAAWPRYQAGLVAPESMNAAPQLKLG